MRNKEYYNWYLRMLAYLQEKRMARLTLLHEFGLLYKEKWEFIIDVYARYLHAQKLSVIDSNCYYNHTINNIGCGVSCVMSIQDARWLEDNFHNQPITVVYKSEEGRKVLDKYFDFNTFNIMDIKQVQEAHDGAGNIHQFRNTLVELTK